MPLLQVENLTTSFTTPQGKVQAVRDVSFELNEGEVLGIVGESGSGKSQMMYTIMGLLADNGVIESGKITFDGEDAWISSRYSYVIYDDEAFDDYPVVYVHRDSHVRDEPSLYGDSLTVARAGSVLRADGDTQWDDRGVAWYYVCCNGYWGWISSRYTSAAG